MLYLNRTAVDQKLNVALLIGGVSFGDQDAKLTRGVDVLIATPGRLLYHTERGGLLLTGVELLVIDEADRMLDMGFIPDIERVCKLVPFTRQTLFFTATMPPEISRITEAFLHNPARIEVSKPATTAVGVSQFQVPAGREVHEKREILRRLLRDAKDLQNAIIFCNRKREVAVVYKSLQKHGFSVGALHGDMDQSARTAALDQFRKGEIPLLVASDVAPRGLELPARSHRQRPQPSCRPPRRSLRAYPRSVVRNRGAPSATLNQSPPITRIFRRSCCGRFAPASDSARPDGRNRLPAVHSPPLTCRR